MPSKLKRKMCKQNVRKKQKHTHTWKKGEWTNWQSECLNGVCVCEYYLNVRMLNWWGGDFPICIFGICGGGGGGIGVYFSLCYHKISSLAIAQRPSFWDYGEVCQLEHLGCLNKYFITHKWMAAFSPSWNEKINWARGDGDGSSNVSEWVHCNRAQTHRLSLSLLHTLKCKQWEKERNNKNRYCYLMHCFRAARNNFEHSTVIRFLFGAVYFCWLFFFTITSKICSSLLFIGPIDVSKWIRFFCSFVCWALFRSSAALVHHQNPIKPLFSTWLDHVLRF